MAVSHGNLGSRVVPAAPPAPPPAPPPPELSPPPPLQPTADKVAATTSARRTIDWNGSQLVTYCVDQLNPGANVVHFSNATQSCYQAGGAILTPTSADALEVLQWQVPTSATGPTSFDYCIDNLTPLTQ